MLARLPGIPDFSEDPLVQQHFRRDIDRFGYVLNSTRIYSYRPSLLHAVRQLGDLLKKSELLEPRLQALVNVCVASINGCPF